VTRVLLVSGSRDWTRTDTIASVIGRLQPDLVVHGACGLNLNGERRPQRMRGADGDAHRLALRRGVTVLPMIADWQLGRAAGPRRNAAMVNVLCSLRNYGAECSVAAFPLPGGRGTRNCVGLARAAGLTVVIYAPDGAVLEECPA
jgi:hypothetical protein